MMRTKQDVVTVIRLDKSIKFRSIHERQGSYMTLGLFKNNLPQFCTTEIASGFFFFFVLNHLQDSKGAV